MGKKYGKKSGPFKMKGSPYKVAPAVAAIGKALLPKLIESLLPGDKGKTYETKGITSINI